ncbi:MAG: signal peptidase I [Candidatus Faecousia sp.]|nr:signal peptidase I [Candidatus Faecousia sp.]
MDGIVGSSDTYPSPAQLSGELERVRAGKRRRSVLRGLLRTLVLCAAAAALAATLWMPVLRVYGASMTPTLREGEVVICLRSKDLQPGDLAAFRLGGKLLLKRCIAGPGQWVDMEEDGTVLVDGVALEEPYLSEKALGACDLTLPFQVPENRWFCMGDHRATSLDSRHSAVGCVSREQLVGKVLFRVWPLSRLGKLT